MLLRVPVSRQTLCYVFRAGEGGRRQVPPAELTAAAAYPQEI
jgi:hypothetical protein